MQHHFMFFRLLMAVLPVMGMHFYMEPELFIEIFPSLGNRRWVFFAIFFKWELREFKFLHCCLWGPFSVTLLRLFVLFGMILSARLSEKNLGTSWPPSFHFLSREQVFWSPEIILMDLVL